MAKARFLDLEEKDRLNPNNMLIRLLAYTLVPFYRPEVILAAKEEFPRIECEEWTDKNRFYALFVAKTSSVFDLKTRLDEEFGFPFE